MLLSIEPPDSFPHRVLLDANVFFSPRLRDLFLHLLATDLYSLHWTREIEVEWTSNAGAKHKADAQGLERCLQGMRKAAGEVFDDTEQGWEVVGHEAHLDRFREVDAMDRHVAAAAYKLVLDFDGDPVALVTNNVRHFPQRAFENIPVVCFAVDDYLMVLADFSSEAVAKTAEFCRTKLKTPPFSRQDYLEALKRLNCPRFSAFLAANWERSEMCR